MSGLEVSEITLSVINKDNDRFRIDSEYFKKEYLENERYLELRPLIKLKETGLQIIHSTEIIRTYVEHGA